MWYLQFDSAHYFASLLGSTRQTQRGVPGRHHICNVRLSTNKCSCTQILVPRSFNQIALGCRSMGLVKWDVNLLLKALTITIGSVDMKPLILNVRPYLSNRTFVSDVRPETLILQSVPNGAILTPYSSHENHHSFLYMFLLCESTSVSVRQV